MVFCGESVATSLSKNDQDIHREVQWLRNINTVLSVNYNKSA